MSEKAFCVMCIRRPFLRALLPKAAPARKGCCDNCGTKTKSLVAIASDDSDDKQLPVKLAYLLQDKDLNLEALHIKEVQKITQYDPKREAHVPTRFCSFNLYKFDLNEESDAPAWPPLKDGVQYSQIADQSVNVTFLRVVQSDRGYPISLYGQVLARDQVDYKCVYLFRRQRDDPQVINGPEDILALDGPYRGLAFSDYMFFEIHLKVKGDGDEDTDEDFSKGVIQYGHVTRPIIKQLPSFRSTVSLVLQLVQAPALAMVAVNILEGVPPSAPFKGRITAGTTRNYKRHMVLYDSRATGDLIGGDHSVLLSRNLVAVPCRLIDHQGRIEIHVCFLDHDYEDDEYADDHSELTYYDYVDRKWKCKGKEIEIEIDEDEDEDEDDGDGDDGDEEDDDGEEDDGDEDEEADGDEEEDDEEEDERRAPEKRPRQVELRRDCPYLDTVNRQVLDFDFEKFCSISLSNLNVYACLVCGKYYQGRGLKSHAYTHSLEAGHHVFINLQTEKVYCLPDGYEINDPSLEDIRHVLNPRFTREQVINLDKNKQWSRALDGSNYLPGMVGLNNIKETDFVNVTIQTLMRITPLRNFFLIPENYQHSKSPLVHRFGELTRKIWHARNFKGQVSPHEFLQAVMKASEKRFQIGVQSDPVEFMSWLLNTLHGKLRSSKKKNRSIIYDCFQGELEVVKEMHRRHIVGDEQDGEAGSNVVTAADGMVTETSRVPFLMLGLDLPPPPLFKDAMEKNIIPQVPLFNILKKFDGEAVTEVVRPSIARMRYRVIRLPKYLILHMRRFTKNNFFVEKNPTLVNFPVKNLELKDYIPLPKPKENEKLRSKYDLIANIVHDGKPGEGCYRVFVQRKSEEAWYEMQDLHVTETLPQMVALSEAYMQIYEQHE